MNQLSVESIKKFNVNELKSEFAKRGLTVQWKKEEFFKILSDAVQEDNSDKQLSISLIKIFLKNIFEEQKEKNLKKHEENVTSITNGKISSINQRLGKLTLDIKTTI